MIDFRPHILKYQVLTEGHEDERGIWHQGTSVFQGEIPCRAVANTKGNMIKFDDGTAFVYSFTIYVDTDLIELNESQLIQVFDKAGRLMFESQIYGKPVYKQLHTKIYV
jgi:hypothetical protein